MYLRASCHFCYNYYYVVRVARRARIAREKQMNAVHPFRDECSGRIIQIGLKGKTKNEKKKNKNPVQDYVIDIDDVTALVSAVRRRATRAADLLISAGRRTFSPIRCALLMKIAARSIGFPPPPTHRSGRRSPVDRFTDADKHADRERGGRWGVRRRPEKGRARCS